MDLEIINRGKTHAEIQRERLGIPDSLGKKPVLYVSSHRGFLDAKYPSHIANFQRVLKGESEQDDKEYAYLDLTTASPNQVVELLRSFVLREDPSRKGRWLPSGKDINEPLPKFVTNVIYLPELDNTGNTKGGSHTFEIDPANARSILPRLKDFLDEKDILRNKSGHKRLKSQN